MAEKPSRYSRYQVAVTGTRYVIWIPVVALFVGALALVLVGAIETGWALYAALFDGSVSEKETLVDFITLADLFLLSTVLYIIALGLYQLFIDDTLPLPHWLVVTDLDDLKEKLTSVVIVVLAVFFLGSVVKAVEPMNIMWEGLGIAAVVGGLSLFLIAFRGSHRTDGKAPRALAHALAERIENERGETGEDADDADSGEAPADDRAA